MEFNGKYLDYITAGFDEALEESLKAVNESNGKLCLDFDCETGRPTVIEKEEKEKRERYYRERFPQFSKHKHNGQILIFGTGGAMEKGKFEF